MPSSGDIMGAMHTNETTIAGLFRTTAPSHHLARQLREKFTALAVDLGKLLPVTPNTTAALRSLRGSLDAAMLAATDPAADEPAPASSGSSGMFGRSTPEAEPPATPPATQDAPPPATQDAPPPATQEGPSTPQVLGPDGAPIPQPRKR